MTTRSSPILFWRVAHAATVINHPGLFFVIALANGVHGDLALRVLRASCAVERESIECTCRTIAVDVEKVGVVEPTDGLEAGTIASDRLGASFDSRGANSEGPAVGSEGGAVGSNRREVQIYAGRIGFYWPGMRFEGVARRFEVAEARSNPITTQFNRGEIHKNIGGGEVA